MSAHEGTVSESTTPEAKKREDRKWEGKDLIQFSRFWFPKILRDALSIYVSLISGYFLQQHILGLVLQARIKEQIDSIFFLRAPDDGILDKKMQQPLKSINSSTHLLCLVLKALITEQIDSLLFRFFSRLEWWLRLNHKCAPDDGILDKKMQRPLKPVTLFVGKLYRSAHWQGHCLAIIIIIVIIITNIIIIIVIIIIITVITNIFINCLAFFITLAPLCIVSRVQISCRGTGDLFCFYDHQLPSLFRRSFDGILDKKTHHPFCWQTLQKCTLTMSLSGRYHRHHYH